MIIFYNIALVSHVGIDCITKSYEKHHTHILLSQADDFIRSHVRFVRISHLQANLWSWPAVVILHKHPPDSLYLLTKIYLGFGCITLLLVDPTDTAFDGTIS